MTKLKIAGTGADADRERQQRDRGKRWTAPQRANPMAEVAAQIIEPRQASLLAQRLHGLNDSAGLKASLSHCTLA